MLTITCLNTKEVPSSVCVPKCVYVRVVHKVGCKANTKTKNKFQYVHYRISGRLWRCAVIRVDFRTLAKIKDHRNNINLTNARTDQS